MLCTAARHYSRTIDNWLNRYCCGTRDIMLYTAVMVVLKSCPVLLRCNWRHVMNFCGTVETMFCTAVILLRPFYELLLSTPVALLTIGTMLCTAAVLLTPWYVCSGTINTTPCLHMTPSHVLLSYCWDPARYCYGTIDTMACTPLVLLTPC